MKLLIAHRDVEESASGSDVTDCAAPEGSCRYIKQCISVSKCSRLFLCVLSWIKDALIDEQLFMISGTDYDRTAHGALDRGIVTAGLALRKTSFNPDRHGL